MPQPCAGAGPRLLASGAMFVALASLGLPPARDAAAEALVTDRPDFTESAETVPPGSAQLESGYTFTRSGGLEEHACGEVLLRVAMGHRAEARLGLNSYVVREGTGRNPGDFEDPSLGVKPRLFDLEPAGWAPAVALLLSSTLRRGAESASDSFEPEAKVAAAWDVTPRIGFSANVGLADADVGGEFSGSASLALGLTAALGAYVEFFGFRPTAGGAADSAYLDGGLTWLVGEDFQLDARAGTGANAADPAYFLGVGLARRW